MNKGPICGRFMKKTRGQKSRATVPLKPFRVWFEFAEMFELKPYPTVQAPGVNNPTNYPGDHTIHARIYALQNASKQVYKH